MGVIVSARFADKVILIIGATAGIGRASAERLAAEGAKLILAARGKQAGDTLVASIRAAGGEAKFVATDMTVEAEAAELVREAMSRYGRLDGAFNNVGTVTAAGPVTEIDGDAWQAELALNLSSVFYGLKHQIPALEASGGGAILNNASACGVAVAPSTPAYTAAKHGVVGLTRSAALDAAASGIRINALLTGGVDTPLLRSLTQSEPGPTAVESLGAVAAMHRGSPNRTRSPRSRRSY
jgi:NAD(P)-dependent dehydrogenase (short-subunit alcohol dehydrogenase family)